MASELSFRSPTLPHQRISQMASSSGVQDISNRIAQMELDSLYEEQALQQEIPFGTLVN